MRHSVSPTAERRKNQRTYGSSSRRGTRGCRRQRRTRTSRRAAVGRASTLAKNQNCRIARKTTHRAERKTREGQRMPASTSAASGHSVPEMPNGKTSLSSVEEGALATATRSEGTGSNNGCCSTRRRTIARELVLRIAGGNCILCRDEQPLGLVELPYEITINNNKNNNNKRLSPLNRCQERGLRLHDSPNSSRLRSPARAFSSKKGE